MPILAPEPDVYPDDLLERLEVGHEAGYAWWALYTLQRHEKELMRRLRSMGIAFCTPLILRHTRSPSGRVRTAHVPLFAGYVFMYGQQEHRYRAMTTNCVSHWLVVPDNTELTCDLRRIRRLIAAGVPLTPEERVEPGTPIEITHGPLAGLEGKLIRRGPGMRLLVEVNFLQRGASAEIESWMIRSASKPLSADRGASDDVGTFSHH